MKRLGIVVAALCLGGCATGYKQFYTPNPGAKPELVAARRASPPPAQPLLDHTNLVGPALAQAYEQEGYFPIGFSSFNGGGNQSESGAVAEGKAVGADLVVVSNPAYSGTRSSVIPITTPTTSTSYSSGTATAYGSSGSVTAYGSGTTTTYGSQTNFIPVSQARYDYLAVYFVKLKVRLGASVVALSNEQRALLQSNRGVVVKLVVDQSPAYTADILVGDFILSIDGQPVDGPAAYSRMMDEKSGHRISVTLWRNGTTLTKEVSI